MTGTAAVAALIAIEAHAARVRACTTFVQGYEHDRATVAQMREYAGCIDTLHPDPLSPEVGLGLKVAIVIVLACMLVGAWKGDGIGVQSVGDRVMGALLWALCAAASMLAIVLIIAGVVYVVS